MDEQIATCDRCGEPVFASDDHIKINFDGIVVVMHTHVVARIREEVMA
jgi:hypothetical protein